MSRQAGLPTAREYCTKLVASIFDQVPVRDFFRERRELLSRWQTRLVNLDFDVLLALVRIADPSRYPKLFDSFKECKATRQHELLLRIAEKTKSPIFSTNFDDAVERTAKEFGVPFLGSIELDPEIRKGGDAGTPPALAGENDPHSKSLYDFAKQVLMRLAEVKSSSAPGDVIQVQ